MCPVHGTRLELQKEENVFFRLSKYGDRLLKLYDEGVDGRPFVFPDTRLNEVRAFVAAGLKDLSVSRTSITWGLPFPGRPGHVVYVWLDALVNYVTALGFGSGDMALYERYWPGIHVIGKDILRFHAVYWPAFLMSAGMPVPRQVVGHGWWLRDARKMSKSVGNVVRPDELVEAFGVDALRWHFVAAMSFGQDANFSDEDFLSVYNADLANGLGNTLSRAVKMSRDWFDGKTPPKKGTKRFLRRAERGVGGPEGDRGLEDFLRRLSAAGCGGRDPHAARRDRRRDHREGAVEGGAPARVLSDGALQFPVGRPLRLPRGAARRRLHARPDRAPHGDGDLPAARHRQARRRRPRRRSRVGRAAARRAAPGGAAAVPEGGREGIFCFQGEDRV